MVKFWNFVVYLTFELLNRLSSFVQDGMLSLLIFCFPSLKKKRREISKSIRSTTTNEDLGFNISFAFGIVFGVWMIIYSTLVILLADFFNFPILDKITLWILIIAGLAYATNYFFIWRNDRYLEYFSLFRKGQISSWSLFFIFIFYCVIIGLFLFFLLK